MIPCTWRGEKDIGNPPPPGYCAWILN